MFGRPDILSSSAGSTSSIVRKLGDDLQPRIGRAPLYLAQVATIKPLLRDMLLR